MVVNMLMYMKTDLNNKILEFLKLKSKESDNGNVSVEELRLNLSDSSQKRLFILELLDAIYDLEHKGFIRSFVSDNNLGYSVELKDKNMLETKNFQ